MRAGQAVLRGARPSSAEGEVDPHVRRHTPRSPCSTPRRSLWSGAVQYHRGLPRPLSESSAQWPRRLPGGWMGLCSSRCLRSLRTSSTVGAGVGFAQVRTGLGDEWKPLLVNDFRQLAGPVRFGLGESGPSPTCYHPPSAWRRAFGTSTTLMPWSKLSSPVNGADSTYILTRARFTGEVLVAWSGWR
jgi:hypothetical protein